MKHLRFALIILLLAVVAAQSKDEPFSISPIIFNEPPAGIRAAGMGNAYTGLADNAEALVWNPAGLAQNSKTTFTLLSNIGFGNLAIKTPTLLSLDQKFKARINGNIGLSFIGFTIPVPLKNNPLTFALAVKQMSNFNNNITWSRLDETTQFEREIEEKYNGGIYSLSGGFGYCLFKNLYIGSSLNFITGNYKKNDNYTDYEDEAVSKNSSNWENKFSGFSVDAGVLLKISRVFSLGSKVSFPYKLYYSKINFKDSDNNVTEYDIEPYIEMPLQVSYGLSVQLMSDFIFVFDFQQKPLHKAVVSIDEQKTDRIFEKANSFRMGVEYTIRKKSYLLPYRFGFLSQLEQIFEPTDNDNLDRGKQVSSHFITTGVGLVKSSFSINIALRYQILQYQTDELPFDIANTKVELKHSRFNILCGIDIFI